MRKKFLFIILLINSLFLLAKENKKIYDTVFASNAIYNKNLFVITGYVIKDSIILESPQTKSYKNPFSKEFIHEISLLPSRASRINLFFNSLFNASTFSAQLKSRNLCSELSLFYYYHGKKKYGIRNVKMKSLKKMAVFIKDADADKIFLEIRYHYKGGLNSSHNHVKSRSYFYSQVIWNIENKI